MTQPHDDFEALTREYAAAVSAKDPRRLAAMYDADVRVFDAWGQWSHEGLADWSRSLEDWLGSLSEEEAVRVGFDDVSASALGDMGLLTGTITFAAVDKAGQVLRSLQERLTWVLRRKGSDGWAILHQHTSFPVGSDQTAIMRRIKD